MKNNNKDILKISSNVEIQQERIVYLLAISNYTYIHNIDNYFIMSKTLKMISSKVNNGYFLKIRRGLLVNVVHISRVIIDKPFSFIQLENGKVFQISRRSYLEVSQKLSHLIPQILD